MKGLATMIQGIPISRSLATSVSTYSEFATAVTSSGTIELLNDITLTGSLSVSGSNVIINGNGFSVDGNGAEQCFLFSATTVVVSSLTVKNCVGGQGGAFYFSGTNATLNSCNVSDSSATYGGGLYMDGGGILTMKSCNIDSNSASIDGGGIYTSATLIMSSCSLTFNDCTYAGAGIYITSGELTMTDCSATDNTANSASGGAVSLFSGSFTASNLIARRNYGFGTLNDIGGSVESAFCTSGCAAGNYGNCSLSYMQNYGDDPLTGDEITCFVNCACAECPAGKSLADAESTSPDDCTECGTGQISAAGDSSCTSCDVGRYATDSATDSGGGADSQVTTGATNCNDCPGGKIAASTSIVCSNCDGGKYSAGGTSSCSDCETGKYATSGSSTCSDCSAGSYSNTNGSASCNDCEGDTYSSSGSSSCDLCLRDFYYALDGECKDCPKGASCDKDGNSTQETLDIDEDYWRVAAKSIDIQSCPLPDACTGGRSFTDEGDGYCAEGYEGPLCAVCSKDYYYNPDDLACLPCSGNSPTIQSSFTIGLFVIGIVLLVLVAILKCLCGSKTKEVSDSVIKKSKLLNEKVQSVRALTDKLPTPNEDGSITIKKSNTDKVTMKKTITKTSANSDVSMTTVSDISTTSTVVTDITTVIKPSSRSYAIGSQLNSLQVKFKSFVAFFQITVNIAFNCDIAFPSLFRYVLDSIVIVNLDILPAFGINCMFESYDYIHKMVVLTIVPLVLSIVLGVFYVLAKMFTASNSSVRKTIVTSFLLLTFLVLINTSTTLFHYFKCDTFQLPDEDGGGTESYMFKDYSIDCDSDRYKDYTMYAIVMIFIYPIGIPVTYFFLLWLHKSTLTNQEALNEDAAHGSPETGHLTFLTKSYKPGYYWFEVLECIRRLLLASIIGVVAESSTAAPVLGFLICLVFNWVFIYWRPYKKNDDNTLGVVLSHSLSVMFLSALLIKIGLTEEQFMSQFLFSGLLILTLLSGPVTIVFQYITWFFACFTIAKSNRKNFLRESDGEKGL